VSQLPNNVRKQMQTNGIRQLSEVSLTHITICLESDS